METIRSVIANTKLDPLEKLLLLTLADSADESGEVVISHLDLSRITGINAGALGRIERRLKGGCLDGRVYSGTRVTMPCTGEGYA